MGEDQQGAVCTLGLSTNRHEALAVLLVVLEGAAECVKDVLHVLHLLVRRRILVAVGLHRMG